MWTALLRFVTFSWACSSWRIRIHIHIWVCDSLIWSHDEILGEEGQKICVRGTPCWGSWLVHMCAVRESCVNIYIYEFKTHWYDLTKNFWTRMEKRLSMWNALLRFVEFGTQSCVCSSWLTRVHGVHDSYSLSHNELWKKEIEEIVYVDRTVEVRESIVCEQFVTNSYVWSPWLIHVFGVRDSLIMISQWKTCWRRRLKRLSVLTARMRFAEFVTRSYEWSSWVIHMCGLGDSSDSVTALVRFAEFVIQS